MEIPVDKIDGVTVAAVPVDELDASNSGEFKRDIAPVLQANTQAGARSEPAAFCGQLRTGRHALLPPPIERQERRPETVRHVETGAGGFSNSCACIGFLISTARKKRQSMLSVTERCGTAPLQTSSLPSRNPSAATPDTRWAKPGATSQPRPVQRCRVVGPGSHGGPDARNRGAIPAQTIPSASTTFRLNFSSGNHSEIISINLGIRDLYRQALSKSRQRIWKPWRTSEEDAALGNGGLGPPGGVLPGFLRHARDARLRLWHQLRVRPVQAGNRQRISTREAGKLAGAEHALGDPPPG